MIQMQLTLKCSINISLLTSLLLKLALKKYGFLPHSSSLVFFLCATMNIKNSENIQNVNVMTTFFPPWNYMVPLVINSANAKCRVITKPYIIIQVTVVLRNRCDFFKELITHFFIFCTIKTPTENE